MHAASYSYRIHLQSYNDIMPSGHGSREESSSGGQDTGLDGSILNLFPIQIIVTACLERFQPEGDAFVHFALIVMDVTTGFNGKGYLDHT